MSSEMVAKRKMSPCALRLLLGASALATGTAAILSGYAAQAMPEFGGFLGPVGMIATTAVLAAATGYGAGRIGLRRNGPLALRACDDAIESRDLALNEHTIVSVTDADGMVSSVNSNFIAELGYEPDDIVGRDPATFYSDPDSFADVRDRLINGEIWKGEQVLKAKDGRLLNFQTTILPRFDERGNFASSISIRTDLTSTRAKAAFEGRNDVLESLRDVVIIYHPETFNVLYVNQTGRDQLGWDEGAVEGKSVADTFSKFDPDIFRNYIAPLKTGEVSQVRIQVEHDIGPVEVVTHFDKGPNGEPCLISVVRDVSERVKAEKLKLMSVSTVSHELRTPLTSIKGALRLLESGALGAMTPESQRMVSIAHRNSDRLLAIVNDILVLEKIEAGDMDFAWQPVDLCGLLQEAAEAHAAFGDETGVTFDVNPGPQSCMVEADPDRLMQVLANLMSNAAKFSPENGTVRLAIKDHDSSWRVCVEDSGPGIPDKARKTIFDSFFQVTNDREYSRPGTGLGLTISKRIIELHRGRIAFDTELGRGTVFYFDLMKRRPVSLGAQNAA